jgi:hypothetical protein
MATMAHTLQQRAAASGFVVMEPGGSPGTSL